MAVIETWLRQDLKGLVTVRSLQGQVFSLDNGGNLIGVKVTKDGQPVTLTGTVTGYCILSDGQTVTVTGSGKSGIQNGNEAYIVLPQLVYSVPGQISIVIKLTSGSVTTTLAACTGYVYRSRTSNEVVPSGTPIPDLATLEEAINRANTAANSANTAATSANDAATAAERVNVAMSKSGKVITLTATNRSGASTNHTVTEPTLMVERANNVVTVTATDADGETSIEFDAVDADEVAELKEAVSTKAEEDGYYEELTAGSAEQLVSTEAVTDTTPYLYRKSGGSVDIGNRETLEKIVGGTVGWNQRINKDKFLSGTNNELTWTANSDGSITIVISETTAVGRTAVLTANTGSSYFNLPKGHVGLICDLNASAWPTGVLYNDSYAGRTMGVNTTYIEPIDRGQILLGLNVASGTAPTTFTAKPQLFDLTAMFGPTIADYIYNLEQANEGAGIAWFRKLFPKDYYPYNPGELISVKPSSHDMVGFNLWDEEWEHGRYNAQGEPTTENGIRSKNFIRIPDGVTQLYASIESMTTNDFRYFTFDSNKNPLTLYGWMTPNTLISFPSEAKYIKFFTAGAYGNSYKNDICINLSHSGSRNGEYEPYEKHSYPLADVELRGPLAIDENGKLVYSGDEYPPSGQVKRKYRLVDLGTLNWDYYTSGANPCFIAKIPDDMKTYAYGSTDVNMVCAMYKCTAANGIVAFTNESQNMTLAFSTTGSYTNRLLVQNTAYTDGIAFKAAMDGVYLLYELATPETEQVAPYTPVQVVDDWGTEEFVDTREVAIPVGHSTSYMANLRDKLQHLPSLAEEDGEYIVKQTGTKMELVKLSSSGLAQSIYESIESTPVASFKDGADGQAMKAVNVAIEPVQDLHGYDAPWPAGGGANLIPLTVDTIKAANGGANTWTGNSKSINGITYSIITDEAGNVTGINMNGTAAGNLKFSLGVIHAVSGVTYGILPFSSADGAGLFGNINPRFNSATDSNIYTSETQTANENKDIAVSYYILNGTTVTNHLITPFIAISSTNPTTFVPYSNICPISGWTGAKVTRTGKNLFDKDTFEFVAGHYITNTGDIGSSGSYSYCATYIPVLPNTAYVFSGVVLGNPSIYNAVAFYDKDKRFIRRFMPANIGENAQFMTPAGCAYIRFNSGQITKNVNTIQLEQGTVASSYEPYKGQTYEVTFPTEAGTVYSGTLTIHQDGSGELMIDRAKVDMGTLTWLYDGAFSASVSGMAKNAYTSTNLICTSYPTKPLPYSQFTCGIRYIGNTSSVGVKDPAYSDATTFKTAVTGQKIVYELATPITYTLTASEIQTLLGVNNVWADAGNIAITYPADTKLYIDKKIAELQALILENNG